METKELSHNVAGITMCRMKNVVSTETAEKLPGFKHDMSREEAEQFVTKAGGAEAVVALLQTTGVLDACFAKDLLEVAKCRETGTVGRLTKRYGKVADVDELEKLVEAVHEQLAAAAEPEAASQASI